MLTVLRAFAWMRWRVLVNSLERTSARDTLERLSLAIEQLGPLLAVALLVPSAAVLAVLSAYAGYALATGEAPLAFELLRYLLLGATAFAIAGPILLPGADRSSAVRLLLLPISRRVLYVAQSAGGLADPWILLTLPIVLALPLGLFAGGAPTGGVVALASGAAFVLTLLGLSSLAGLGLQLLVRNRRRGELLALLFIVVVPLVAVVPGLMGVQRRGEGGTRGIPSRVEAAASRAFAYVPSELHTTAAREGVGGSMRRAVLPAALLGLLAAVLHVCALIAFGRLLDSPLSGGAPRGGGTEAVRLRRLPGLSSGASAVAVAQLRLAFRTPRGRSILLSPAVVTAMFAFLIARGGDLSLGLFTLRSGFGLAIFGGAVSLLSILPFAMNQFALDRSGLTLMFLAPLRDIDLLIGKLVGNGLIAALTASLCLAAVALLSPGSQDARWLALVLALLSTYCLAAPVAAALSAVLPRPVDLNSIGSRSNAHGLAGLLGMVAFLVAAAPAVGVILVGSRTFGWGSATWLILGWSIASIFVCRALLVAVVALFARRRENLALVAASR